MLWARMLAYVTGMVNQELLLRNEYLGAENRILRGKIKGRLCFRKVNRRRWLRLLTGWDARLWKIWQQQRTRAPFSAGIESSSRTSLTDRDFAEGYDRIVGALANLGFLLSDQTVGNILRRHGLSPAPKRKQAISWRDFIRPHMEVLVGTDFFTVEVLTLKGLVTYYVLLFIHLESRRVSLAGVTPYPGHEWTEPQARNATMGEWGFLRGCRYLLHDRDTKLCASFRELIESGSVKTIRMPARSPNLNSFAERWVRSVKEECLSKLILFGERSLRERCSNM